MAGSSIDQDSECQTKLHGAGMAGGYGLDDSDFDEFLASSSSEAVAAGLQPPALPPLIKFVAATVFRGPQEAPSRDACRLVPSNRWDSSQLAACP